MISSQDRSFYIGASDTTMVVGNWNTQSWSNWWLEKLGIHKNKLSTLAMKTGNNFEHKILDSLNIEGLEKDKQIIIDRLRVNLDGNTKDCIYEVKTYNEQKEFKVSKQYWRQTQVEMYASKIHKIYIVAYALEESDYKNYFNKIDKKRLQLIPIEYDENFINNEYIPKLNILIESLKNGKFPKIERRIKMKYNELTVEECFVKYHTQHIACICNGDKEEVIFCKE